MDIKKEAYEKAVESLEKCATPNGFYAAFPGYDAVWSRDSVVTSLGASLVGKKFRETFRNSLITLGKHQAKSGQIPNAVDIWSNTRKPHVDFTTLDSSLWFVIGHHIYKQRYKDSSLYNKEKVKIKKALSWISHLDTSNDGLPEQQPTSDWQDAFPHKYGHTINTQALYYKSLILENKKKDAEKVKHIVNWEGGIALWEEPFYLPWRWKNHNAFHERGNWFDSLGNLLAIVFNLADSRQTNLILNHIKVNEIDKPYPVKAIYPPIRKKDKDWHDYFEDCEARAPYHYLNGGIWTFIGGFYVLALIKAKQFKEAEQQLEKLAHANIKLKVKFPEWIDGKTGKIGKSHSGYQEGNQAWNAGMYILAYESLKRKKVLL
ncbi:MAG: hypothetical protein A3D48_04280 [Candidatus Yanofskybacteria bacterium RIFCSPHIGHO2_02_FULL_43_17]|nr:MAG: hypothetical protein A3D48_04280 [Candidatus Yanofskybacteria bacterium RIFCSPHIGHO2_02_FULL_43_17]